ncbi:MAG: helix-turn-helix transcriptional regulator [Opitutaceae bacterium]|jgi:transcriptional regulator with XRE-family HTH domain
MPIGILSVADIRRGIAARVRARRLQLGWSRKTLAAHAGISPWTLKLFENSGNVSLDTLVKIASALDAVAEFQQLFAPAEAMSSSLEELEKLHPVSRKRGRTLP